MTNTEPVEPAHRVIEPMILEMKPLANAQRRRVPGKAIHREFGAAVLAQESHVEVPVIGRSLRLSMAGGGNPSFRQVVEAVPVNARCASDKKISGSVDTPSLDLFGAERGHANL